MMRRLRVVVGCCWAPGRGQGIGTAATELAIGLRQVGCDVLYLSPPPAAAEWSRQWGIETVTVGPDLSPEDGVRAVLAAVKSFEADVVINNDHPYVQSALPAIDCRKIVICHAMRWATVALAVFNHQYADRVVAISYDMLAVLVDRGVPAARIAVVPNGVRDPRAGAAAELPASTGGGALRVVFAGNWSRVKGGDRLLRAIECAPAWVERIQMECFGDGPLLASAKRKESTWFRVRGRVERLAFLDSLRAAHVIVVPSRVEGCPMTVIEAMSLGLVPIVSDGGGAMRWMVNAGVDGFVARGRRWAEDMWSVLELLESDRQRAAQIGRAARARYAAAFEISGIAKQLIGLVSDERPASVGVSPIHQCVRWHRPHQPVTTVEGMIQRMAYKRAWLRPIRPKEPMLCEAR